MPVEASDLTAAAAATTMVAGAATSLIEPVTGLTLMASGMTAMFASEKQRELRRDREHQRAADEHLRNAAWVDEQTSAALAGAERARMHAAGTDLSSVEAMRETARVSEETARVNAALRQELVAERDGRRNAELVAQQTQETLLALLACHRKRKRFLKLFVVAGVVGGGYFVYSLWRKAHQQQHVVGVPLLAPEQAEVYAREHVEAQQMSARQQIGSLAAGVLPRAFTVGDRVRYVGGGRFDGPQVWLNGSDRLDPGDEGTVSDVLTAGAWRIVVRFPRVNVRLGPEDIEPVHSSLSARKSIVYT
eukprot:TRINITY_DN11977_c0_g1_i1.p1 TRINITY_DN11977_c0_g1~~TRINITY_DN11977_c0_g1_i1.p1  ORF type:complete len:326 (+),score=117.10 TRINITY_DN11977_c0_g1_i1:66-980(+)